MFTASKVKHVINKAGDESGYSFGFNANTDAFRFNAMKAKYFELVADESLSVIEQAAIRDWLNLMATKYGLVHLK